MLEIEHWTAKGDVRLFLWRKAPAAGQAVQGTILFVHGSSMASQPTFDLAVPGRPDSSVMDWFAARGFDTWCLDNEGYGRSDKKRPINFDISNGADDLAAAADFIFNQTKERKLLIYGISSGALKAALFGSGPYALVVNPQEFGIFLRAEHEKWGKVVRDTGATIN